MNAAVVEVLGAARIRTAAGSIVALTPHERRVVTALALAGRDGLEPDGLVAALWPTDPPRTARQSLHNHVHRLRVKAGHQVVEWHADRYRLSDPSATDVASVVELAASARSAMDRGEPAAALDLLVAIRSASRGAPFADLEAVETVEGERARVQEILDESDDLHARALLALGRSDVAVAELERLVARQPDREGRWSLLLTALTAQGRRTDALDAYQRARRTLIERHGVEPGPGLQALQRELLEGPRDVAVDGDATTDVVGRDAVVEQLIATLRGHGRVWLHGEAGIGKSSVLRALGAAWQDGEVVVLDCSANPWTALGPVSALLQRLGRRLDRLGLPVTMDALTASAGLDDNLRRPGPLTTRAVDAITVALTSEPGTLLLLDDVERAGPTTSAILAEVIARAQGVAVVMTSRGTDEGLRGVDPGGPTMRLEGLDRDGLAALATATGHPPEPLEGSIDRLHVLTAGHPMLARELLTASADVIDDGDPAWDDDEPMVPARLRLVLQSRIDRLPRAARRALDAAAVMGQVLDRTVLRRVIDLAQLEPPLQAGILTTDDAGTLRFSHELFRRVAYEAVPDGRRQELHHAIGIHSSSLARRARHLLAAADLDPRASIAAASQAADHFLEEQAYADAALLFAQGAALAEQVGMDRLTVLDLQLEAADARRLAGLSGHAEPLLDVAEEVVGLGHVSLRRRATVAAVQLGEAVDPGPLQQRAARLADQALGLEADRAWRARLSATSSQLHATAGRPDRCRRLLVQALELAGEDDHVIVDVHPFAYMALGHPDDLGRRELVADRLGLAAARVGSAPAAWEAGHLRFSCALMRGDGLRARAMHTEMSSLIAQVGDAPRRWSLGYQESALAVAAGKLEDAEGMAEEALQIGLGVAPARAMSAYSGQLFEIRRQQGRLDELAETMVHLIAAQPEIAAWRAAGSLVLAGVDPDRSGALLDELAGEGFGSLPRDFAWLAGMMSLGRAAVAHADPDRAAIVLPHLVPHGDLVCWQGTCTYGPVAEVLADLGALVEDHRTAAWADRAEGLIASLRG